MSKAYHASCNWANEDYSFFERIHSKAKARKVSEKAASFTGRDKAKYVREAARHNKEVRLGIPMPEEPLVCNIPASTFFDDGEPRYAA